MIQKPIPETAGLCSHFVYRQSTISPGFYYVTSSGALVITHTDQSLTTVDAWNEWLQEQYNNGTPVVIVYPLATPIEAPLTAEEIAAYKAMRTNKPVTTILNDGGAGMSVSYVADTKAYIDNKFSALEAAILSTGGNV